MSIGAERILRLRMEHYFPDVPGLGNVAVSRHAQARMVEDGISEHDFKEALFNGSTTPDGQDVLWREKDGVRMVILRKPTPFKGAMLAKTVYRVRPAAHADVISRDGHNLNIRPACA
jgi:hypothetical protein